MLGGDGDRGQWRRPDDLDRPTDTGAAGSPIVEYTATAAPGGQMCSALGGGRECTLTGLATGQQHTVTVTAKNSHNLVSDPSTPATVDIPAPDPSAPDTPTDVTVTVRGREALVSWTPPAALTVTLSPAALKNSGTPTGYEVVAEPGPARCQVPGPAHLHRPRQRDLMAPSQA